MNAKDILQMLKNANGLGYISAWMLSIMLEYVEALEEVVSAIEHFYPCDRIFEDRCYIDCEYLGLCKALKKLEELEENERLKKGRRDERENHRSV